ncbi:TetR/AcrR family transcriptional regulator [Tsukamurella sp. 8F]|uniref:TetR/AcrR family transcriptional regulator n=1 Tax=unclassified Tsukamurella TaxID=2633480 RepID=UPI0023B8D153|nr:MULTISPECIES: TetR/AcrR family transcriptional regulator [unclassified Tsukamurella]MDF0528514.1 TetR/AcrR family transcriptional regulator [Tsukamurella sp. 8J]MDF0586340.1 TetR/AcrR family transcriptional regulator [Tsukamurella sp. 8F]
MTNTPTRTRTADVRGALVGAAIAVLEREGLRGLTVRAVAKEAGVAPMGVYNHFTDKSGLQLAVVDFGFARLADTIRAVPDAEPVARMLACGHEYRRIALEHPQVYRLMFGPDKGHGGLDNPPRAFDALVQTILFAQAGGVVRPGEPTSLAKNVWAAIHGAVMLELDAVGPPDLPTSTSDDYDGVLAMILRGLAPDSA